MAQTAPFVYARGMSTLAEAAAEVRSLAQGMPSTSSKTSRSFTFNLPVNSENSCLNAQGRLKLEKREDEEEEKESDESKQADKRILKAVRRIGIRILKQFDLKRNKIFESWLER